MCTDTSALDKFNYFTMDAFTIQTKLGKGISSNELHQISQIMDVLMLDISQGTREALLSSAIDLLCRYFSKSSSSGPELSDSSCFNTRVETVVNQTTRQSRKRKLEDSEENWLGAPEAKKPTYELRTSTPDNNNNDTSSNKVILSRSTATYDICPKTGKVYHRQETWLLTDRQRHARFKTEKSLLIKTTTRCMRMKAYKSQTYCCFRKCFKRRPKI